MAFLETYGKEIVSLLVPVIAWVFTSFFKSKPKLHVAIPHQFTFLVQQPRIDADGNQISPTQTVHTNSYLISNAGRERATHVELVFNWKPMCLNLWPVRHYEEHIESDQRCVLIFESLAPNEYLGIEVLSINNELPALVTVRSSECVAKNIQMYPQPIVSSRKRNIAAFLLFLGLATAVYLTIVLIQFLVLRTPLGH